MLIAHRGGAALRPENTLPAFRDAVHRWEADMLELDLRTTRDGEVVVLHDATVDRTTDGVGPVREMTWKEVAQLDAGFRFRDLSGRRSWQGRGVGIPRFEDVLEALPETRIIAEVKTREAAKPFVEVVRRHRAHRRVLMATAEDDARAGRHGYPGPSSASRTQIRLFMLLHRTAFGPLYTPATDALQIPDSWEGRQVASDRVVAKAHARNIPVHVWTVNAEEDMERLLDWGVDGILTDRPDRLARVLGGRVERDPPPGLRDGGPPDGAGR